MIPKIGLLSISSKGNDDSSIIFKKFGSSKKNHPNVSWSIELTENSIEAFLNAIIAYKIKLYPTFIFAQILQEKPLKLVPIVRIRGHINPKGLESIFKDILSGTIPIPKEGSQGLLADSNGNIINGFVEDFKFPWWLLALGAAAYGISTISTLENIVEPTEIP